MERWRGQAPVRRVVPARRALAVVVLVAVLWAVSASLATASSGVSISISAGSLGVTAPAVNDFAVVVLDGTVQVTRAPLEPFSVTDARGSGQGWSLTLQATPFREWDGNGYVTDGKALPAGSLGLDGLAVTPEGTDSPSPAIRAGPYILDESAVTVATAPVGTGMGTFVFQPTSTLAVAVPAHTYARVYRSELSVSVTSGP